MKRLLAVAYLEARPRAGLLVVALALGTVPTALALAAPDALDATQAAQAVFVLAALLPPIAALLLGASMLGRDLAERRLSFYLTRPLSLTTTWSGKILGTAALLLLSAAAVTLPAGLAGIGMEVPDLEPLPGLGLGRLFMTVAIASFFFLVLSHVVATCLRGPALAVAAALGAGTALAAAFIRLMGRLLDDRAYEDASRMALAFVAAASVVLLTAATVHLHRSRVEPRRAHLSLALLTWGGLGACVLVADLASRAALDVTPGEIRVVEVVAPPSGTWVAVRGVAVDRSDIAVGLLIDTASGRWQRGWRRNAALESTLPEPEPMFATAGRFFAWASERELDMFRLERRPVALGARPAPARPADVSLMDDGGIAWIARQDARTLLHVASATGAPAQYAIESARERPKILEASSAGVVVAAFGRDLITERCRAGETEMVARFAGAAALGLAVSSARRRALIDRIAGAPMFTWAHGGPAVSAQERAAMALAILDLESGGIEWIEVGEHVDAMRGRCFALPLADGSVLLLQRGGRDASVVVFAPDGGRDRTGRMAGTTILDVAGECAPGRLLVAVAQRVAVLDVEAMSVTPLGAGRLAAPLPWASRQVIHVPRPGEGASRLVITPEGALMRIDPAAMTMKRVAGPS